MPYPGGLETRRDRGGYQGEPVVRAELKVCIQNALPPHTAAFLCEFTIQATS